MLQHNQRSIHGVFKRKNDYNKDVEMQPHNQTLSVPAQADALNYSGKKAQLPY